MARMSSVRWVSSTVIPGSRRTSARAPPPAKGGRCGDHAVQREVAAESGWVRAIRMPNAGAFAYPLHYFVNRHALFQPQFWASSNLIPSDHRSAGGPDTSTATTPMPLRLAISKRLAASCARAHRDQQSFMASRCHRSTLVALLSGGHVLLIGVPGLAKRRWSRLWAWCWAWKPSAPVHARPECRRHPGFPSARGAIPAPLLPLHQGPVFAQLLMADEINRASRHQRRCCRHAGEHVTVAGNRHDLPRPSMCWRPRIRWSRRHYPCRSAARPFPAADRCRLPTKSANAR